MRRYDKPPRPTTRRRWLVLALAMTLAGCASMKTPLVSQTEDLLARSGFEPKSIDDPNVARHAESLPVRRLVKANQADGSSRYVFSDPKGCKCVYVGDDHAYGHYVDMVKEQKQIDRVEAEHQAELGMHDEAMINYNAQSGLW